MDRLDCDRMFVAVMELGSFAAASQRIGTSSGQASKLVQRLESELGVRLLNRTTRALSPTEEGRAYFERVRSILEELDELDQSVRNVAQVPRGRLRITAPLTLGHGVLSTALSSFALRYPEVMLDVQFSDRIASLVDEGFDLAVRVGRPADSTLVARKLGQARLQVVASESYLAKRGAPLRPEDLTRHDCVIDTNIRDPLTWRFQDNGRPISVTVAGRIRYSTAEACIAAAEAGLGIAIGPDFATRPGLAAGRLRCVLESFVEEPMGIHVLYPPGRHLAAKVRAFVDFMVEYFRANEPR